MKHQRKQSGISTSNVVQSAHKGDNAGLFKQALYLHVKQGACILDMTFGLGAFWTKIDATDFKIVGCDIELKEKVVGRFPNIDLKTGIDFARLPFLSQTFDAAVLDPPYMEGFYREKKESLAGQGTHHAFQNAYTSVLTYGDMARKGRFAGQDRVIDAYLIGASEAHRVLKDDGILFVKCQDAVSANIQRLVHVEIITALESMGFYTRDLFVLVRSNAAGMSRVIRQVHARKNHSYLIVFQKRSLPIMTSNRDPRPPRIPANVYNKQG